MEKKKATKETLFTRLPEITGPFNNENGTTAFYFNFDLANVGISNILKNEVINCYTCCDLQCQYVIQNKHEDTFSGMLSFNNYDKQFDFERNMENIKKESTEILVKYVNDVYEKYRLNKYYQRKEIGKNIL